MNLPNRVFTFTTALGASFLFALPAFAVQTFTVDSTNDQIDDDVTDGVCHTDAGACTLRAAVMQANRADSSGAIIELPAGTYTLSLPAADPLGDDNGDLDFTSQTAPIALVGAGADVTTIDAAQIDRVIAVSPGTTVSIRGVSITHGMTGGAGGGINNQGTLTLTDAVVTENHSQANGGGIVNRLFETGTPGSMTLERTTVANNSTGSGATGGGIMNNQPLTMSNSIVRNNTSMAGGGINSTGAPLTVTRSSFVQNHSDYGGGIMAVNAELVMVNSTIALNVAGVFGGGIYYGANDAVVMAHLYNTTIAFNDVNPTISTGGFGGGVYIENTNGTGFNLHNSLLAANFFGNGPVQDDCAGTLQSNGRNLLGVDTGCTVITVSGSWDFVNSALGDFGDHGGPTPTVALFPGNNAIDGGDPAGCTDGTSPLTTDQRGSPRPVGVACDVGAFEWTSAPSDRIFADGFDG